MFGVGMCKSLLELELLELMCIHTSTHHRRYYLIFEFNYLKNEKKIVIKNNISMIFKYVLFDDFDLMLLSCLEYNGGKTTHYLKILGIQYNKWPFEIIVSCVNYCVHV